MLIYKATELVNFAQGDLLMLGAFVCYMAVVWWGLDYWLAFLIAVPDDRACSARCSTAVLLRRVIGQPQFAVVMLTIGLGADLPHLRQRYLGSEIYTLPTPFAGVTKIAGVTLSHQYLSIIVGTVDPVRRALRLLQPHAHRRCHAGDLAEPARCLLHGDPGQADLLD